jgi:DNA invertase Pin-like site-specific DNA recombinase
VPLKVLEQAIDTSTPTGRLMFNMLGAIAQFERELMLERQREGVAKAKAEGKYKGRAPTAGLRPLRFVGCTLKASARVKLPSGCRLAGQACTAWLARALLFRSMCLRTGSWLL